MAVAMIGPKFYAWDKNGKPLAFGKLYTYEARTNVPKDTYQSEDQVVANTNPVILNGEGYANIYLSGSYKMVLKDSSENEIWSSDPVSSSEPQEWVICLSATYLSGTSFKLVGNFQSQYEVGRRVRIDNNTANYAYSTVISSVFSAGETTVVVSDSVITTGILEACVSIIGEDSIPPNQNIVSNISELLLITDKPDKFKIFVGGYYEDGDGGGGHFYWDALSTETENGGTILGVGTGRWKRIVNGKLNIKWFGAKGDGVFDDSPPIQATIDYASSKSAGEVVAPYGNYRLVTGVEIKNNVGLSGAGKGYSSNQRTVFEYEGLLQAFHVTGFYVKLSEFMILNKSALAGGGTGGIGIRLSSTQTLVENVTIMEKNLYTRFEYGVRTEGAIDGTSTTFTHTFRGVYIYGCTVAMDLQVVNNETIDNCFIESNDIGLRVDNASNITVINGTVLELFGDGRAAETDTSIILDINNCKGFYCTDYYCEISSEIASSTNQRFLKVRNTTGCVLSEGFIVSNLSALTSWSPVLIESDTVSGMSVKNNSVNRATDDSFLIDATDKNALFSVDAGNNSYTSNRVKDLDNSFLPTLTFGGASVGIVYTVQEGQFNRVGNMMHLNISITISNNGTSTGIAQIGNVPKMSFNLSTNVFALGTLFIAGITESIATNITRITSGNTSLSLRYKSTGNGNDVSYTDTQFDGNETIYASIAYQVE